MLVAGGGWVVDGKDISPVQHISNPNGCLASEMDGQPSLFLPDKQTDRKTDKQADRQTYKDKDKKTKTKTKTKTKDKRHKT